jgi:hypothetical protein
MAKFALLDAAVVVLEVVQFLLLLVDDDLDPVVGL